MITGLLPALQQANGVRFHPCIDASGLSACESTLGFRLPSAHAELLRKTNGLEAYHGYFRLFGLRSQDAIDALAWNEPTCWKFAWDGRCDAFWCFGETGWGDQYAYSVAELKEEADPSVYLVECISMTPEIIGTSFEDFMETEFVVNAVAPYDPLVPAALGKLGPLENESLVIHTPSLLLGGTESVEALQKMSRHSAMICNGDIAIELDRRNEGGLVVGVEPYEDREHRMRLRLVWSDETP